jgi:hypothetical protein
VVFVAIAGGYALTHTTDVRLHWLIAAPALLLLIGAAATAMALRRILAAPEHTEPIDDVADPT